MTVAACGVVRRAAFERWLGALLWAEGAAAAVFRVKGVLNVADAPHTQAVVQAVHELFEVSDTTRRWPPGDAAARRNRIVFIGRNLDADALNASFVADVMRAAASSDEEN